MPAFAKRGLAAAVNPITLRCPNASRIQSIAALFLMSGLIPSAEAKIATASKNTEGAPESATTPLREAGRNSSQSASRSQTEFLPGE